MAATHAAKVTKRRNNAVEMASGLVKERGQLHYRAGSAEFRQEALVTFPSEEANKEIFW